MDIESIIFAKYSGPYREVAKSVVKILHDNGVDDTDQLEANRAVLSKVVVGARNFLISFLEPCKFFLKPAPKTTFNISADAGPNRKYYDSICVEGSSMIVGWTKKELETSQNKRTATVARGFMEYDTTIWPGGLIPIHLSPDVAKDKAANSALRACIGKWSVAVNGLVRFKFFNDPANVPLNAVVVEFRDNCPPCATIGNCMNHVGSIDGFPLLPTILIPKKYASENKPGMVHGMFMHLLGHSIGLSNDWEGDLDNFKESQDLFQQLKVVAAHDPDSVMMLTNLEKFVKMDTDCVKPSKRDTTFIEYIFSNYAPPMSK